MNETTLTIAGSLTATPELRTLPNGDFVANFTVASNSRRYNKQTDRYEDGDALFMRCSAFRGLAENLGNSLDKGARVIVTGNLRQRSYEKDGEKKTVFELQVTEVGASMLFATVKVNKAERTGGSGAGGQDRTPVSVPDDEEAPF